MLSKEIRKIEVITLDDETPDTSFLGEYSNQPGPDAIDRKACGDWKRGEYQYFNPAMTGAETGNPESPAQDYARFEAFNRGDWHFIGVKARAEVVIGDTIQTITSGGLWGIESDSDADYVTSVKKDELSALVGILLSLGFSGFDDKLPAL